MAINRRWNERVPAATVLKEVADLQCRDRVIHDNFVSSSVCLSAFEKPVAEIEKTLSVSQSLEEEEEEGH